MKHFQQIKVRQERVFVALWTTWRDTEKAATRR